MDWPGNHVAAKSIAGSKAEQSMENFRVFGQPGRISSRRVRLEKEVVRRQPDNTNTIVRLTNTQFG